MDDFDFESAFGESTDDAEIRAAFEVLREKASSISDEVYELLRPESDILVDKIFALIHGGNMEECSPMEKAKACAATMLLAARFGSLLMVLTGNPSEAISQIATASMALAFEAESDE